MNTNHILSSPSCPSCGESNVHHEWRVSPSTGDPVRLPSRLRTIWNWDLRGVQRVLGSGLHPHTLVCSSDRTTTCCCVGIRGGAERGPSFIYIFGSPGLVQSYFFTPSSSSSSSSSLHPQLYKVCFTTSTTTLV